MAGFPDLPKQVDLPAFEREVQRRWAATAVFRRTLEKTAHGPRWISYEGPPTANGRPGVHHVEARVFKDLFPRYKTMKGFHAPRRAGWDCHGLPVELQVEKELGFTRKRDIEAYGIARFNARCRESALRHVEEFAAMTERMGYWVDLDNAYLTMAPEYVESVWWSLERLFRAGLLVEDHRVTPYCPRDETPLSDHEVAQGYREVTDPAVYVRFPVTSGPWAGRASLLAWTTTPWTLVSNTALAVHPRVSYAVATGADGTPVILAEELVGKVVGDGAEVLDVLPGASLVGTSYRRPLDLVDLPGSAAQAFTVQAGSHVTVDSGTGVVHLAPAFGAEDHAIARVVGLPLVNPIEPDGRFAAGVPLVGGLFFKDADRVVIEELRRRELLWRREAYAHPYPHCWRCGTPLLYYALPSWYVRTTAVKQRLVAENERTAWHPAHIKHGRFGEWLDGNVDWALSRHRYWGTPLPIWRCTADRAHVTCVGSLADLSARAGRDLSTLDPHRPYVDDVEIACETCGGTARRVPDVIDVWYDSGAMPFAQWGAPHREEAAFQASHPAQFICEGIDQTRGWFYSLLAVGTPLFDRSPYETVLCLGLILDADGRKMSKHLGNVLDPFALFDEYGADAVRWHMLAGGSPWADRRLGPEQLADAVRKVLLTYWNTASFLVLYANAAGWTPADAPTGPRPVADRWILAELNTTARAVGGALDGFDTAEAGRHLAAFIDSLSNWYVRISRRRFWQGDRAALATLYECLEKLTRLMAPFTPFLTDYLWDRLFAGDGGPDSVHLAAWPEPDASDSDATLRERMRTVRRVVDLGRAARAAAGVRVRQPLARAMVAADGFTDLPAELVQVIADELNVNAVDAMARDLVQVTVAPNFRSLGRRFGPRTQAVAAAIRAAGPTARETLTVTVGGEPVQLDAGDIVLTTSPPPGWAVTTDATGSVALDLAVTDDLLRAGRVRDVVRQLQEARKNLGLQVTDRIRLRWATADPDLAAALRSHREQLAGELLADEVGETDGELPLRLDAVGLTVRIDRAR